MFCERGMESGKKAEIISHRYDGEQLFFTVQEMDEEGTATEREVTSRELKDPIMKLEYWGKLNAKAKEQQTKNYGFVNYVLPVPEKLLSTKVINGEMMILTLFPTFSCPVYVPSRVLKNHCPMMLSQFYEKILGYAVEED